MSGLLRAREGARDFVAKSMPAQDLAAVGTLSVDTGWKLLVNFTRDRAQLSHAIDSLGMPALGVQALDPLSFAFTDPSGTRGGLAEGSKSTNEAMAAQDANETQAIQRAGNDNLARGRVTRLLTALGGIARVLDSVRGRKHLVFFSEGFETRLLSGKAAGGGRDTSLASGFDGSALDASTTRGANEAAVSGEIWKVDSDVRYGSSSLRDLLGASLANFNRSDAVLDAIDIGGLRADGDAAGWKAGSGTDALSTMASETDGDFVRNANRLGPELKTVADRTSLVYLLVYEPKGLAKPGAFHKLKVEVKAPAARVLARSGYYEPRPYASLSPLERLLASGDLVTGGTRGDGIDGHLIAAAFASPAEAAQVPVVLEIPGASLLLGDEGGKTGVQIYAYANDAEGTLADYVATEMTLDLAKTRQSLAAGGLKFYGTLYLPPGDFTVRALVRNSTTGRSGVFTARVTVPGIPGGAPTVLPPFFAEPAGRWVMVRAQPRADAPPREADYPFAVAGEAFIPGALPALANGSESRVAVVTYNFPAGSGPEPSPLQLRAEIVGNDGRARPVELSVARKSDAERGGGRKLLLSFTPGGLPPGRYALKVAVTDPASKATAEAASVFEADGAAAVSAGVAVIPRSEARDPELDTRFLAYKVSGSFGLRPQDDRLRRRRRRRLRGQIRNLPSSITWSPSNQTSKWRPTMSMCVRQLHGRAGVLGVRVAESEVERRQLLVLEDVADDRRGRRRSCPSRTRRRGRSSRRSRCRRGSPRRGRCRSHRDVRRSGCSRSRR